MTVSTRRVWRAAPLTLALVWSFAALALVALPLLAIVVHQRRPDSGLPALLGVLAVAAVLYAWRFGLHPALRATDAGLAVSNPWRTVSLPWSDITVVAPGPNGLVIGTEEAQVEAWCVQKSGYADRRGLRTRADQVVDELLDLLEVHDPPVRDPASGLRIRRARPGESALLTRMERAASEAHLGHIFDPGRYPYPVAEVSLRWRRLLRDRLTRVRILELAGNPVGFVAYCRDTVLHLGMVPEYGRRGFGSALLCHATGDVFDSRVPAARLWVLADNTTARDFYGSLGWRETGERRRCEFPPHPTEIELCCVNPAAPRRALAEQHRA